MAPMVIFNAHDARPDRYLRAGRIIAAVLAGAGAGGAVAAIWQAGSQAAARSCANVPSSVICFGFTPRAEALAASGLVIAAGILAAFGGLRIRPLSVTIPAGLFTAFILMGAAERAVPDGMALPPWAAAVTVGAGLAGLALWADRGMPLIAGIIALGLAIVAVIAIPPVIRAPLQADVSKRAAATAFRAAERQFAALGVPLLLPQVPGYRATSADGSGGMLSVYLAPDQGDRDAVDILVTITAAKRAPGTEPGYCTGPQPAACRKLQPAVWLVSYPQDHRVITWRGTDEVVADGGPHPPVSTQALVQAATGLRPATASALAHIATAHP